MKTSKTNKAIHIQCSKAELSIFNQAIDNHIIWLSYCILKKKAYPIFLVNHYFPKLMNTVEISYLQKQLHTSKNMQQELRQITTDH